MIESFFFFLIVTLTVKSFVFETNNRTSLTYKILDLCVNFKLFFNENNLFEVDLNKTNIKPDFEN